MRRRTARERFPPTRMLRYVGTLDCEPTSLLCRAAAVMPTRSSSAMRPCYNFPHSLCASLVSAGSPCSLLPAEIRRASHSRPWRPSPIMYEFGRSSGSCASSAAASARLAACRWPRVRRCLHAAVVPVERAARGAADVLGEQRGGACSSRWVGWGRMQSGAARGGRPGQPVQRAHGGTNTRANTTGWERYVAPVT